LTKGDYTLEIRSNYDPEIFAQGTKEFEMATMHPTLGGKNPLLAFSFLAIGLLCFTLGVIFFCAA
jgi:hypothetical protein